MDLASMKSQVIVDAGIKLGGGEGGNEVQIFVYVKALFIGLYGVAAQE